MVPQLRRSHSNEARQGVSITFTDQQHADGKAPGYLPFGASLPTPAVYRRCLDCHYPRTGRLP